MARFYAEIQGNRGAATRMGTAQSGISAHPRGWNVGVRVDGDVYGTQDDGDPDDRFDIRLTSGSNGYNERPFAEVIRDNATGGWIVTLTRPDGTRETLTYSS